MTSIYDVPYGVLDAILSACDATDLARVECSCRALRMIASRNELWKNLLAHYVGKYMPWSSKKHLASKQQLQVWLQRDFLWSELGEASCAPRFLHRAATTSRGSYMFGGDSAQLLCFNDVWKVGVRGQNVRVQQCHCTSATYIPVGRSACSICAIGDKLFVFGGLLFFDPVTFSEELWMLDTRTHVWKQLTPKGEAPCGRWGHTMVASGNKIFLFAGSCPGRTFNDLWSLEIDNDIIEQLSSVDQKDPVFVQWNKINALNPPQARGGHASAVIGHHLYVFGGNTLEMSFDDLWELNLESPMIWTRIEALGQRPSARIGHCAVAIGHYLLIYGGRNFLTQVFCNGVFIYDTRYNIWERCSVRGNTPMERTGHAAIPVAEGVLFFGGLTANQHATSEVLFLDLFGSESTTNIHYAQRRMKSDLGVFDFGSPRAVNESSPMGFPNIPTSRSESSSPVPFSFDGERDFDVDDVRQSSYPHLSPYRGHTPTLTDHASARSRRHMARQVPSNERSSSAGPETRARRSLSRTASERNSTLSNPSSPTPRSITWFTSLGGQLMGVLSMFSPRAASRHGLNGTNNLERAALKLSGADEDLVVPPSVMAIDLHEEAMDDAQIPMQE